MKGAFGYGGWRRNPGVKRIRAGTFRRGGVGTGMSKNRVGARSAALNMKIGLR